MMPLIVIKDLRMIDTIEMLMFYWIMLGFAIFIAQLTAAVGIDERESDEERKLSEPSSKALLIATLPIRTLFGLCDKIK